MLFEYADAGGFRVSEETAQRDEELVRRAFWPKVRRVATKLPFAEDLLAGYYCAFDRNTPRQVRNWRGRPLTDRLAVVELIGATTTKTGLKVESALDTRSYQKGIKVSKAEMKRLDITGDQFHPEWNYTIRPRQPSKS